MMRSRAPAIGRFIRRLWLIDTTGTKVSLALYATIVAIGLFQSGGECHLLVCSAVPYAEVWYMWASAWTTYAVLKWARIATALLHSMKGHRHPEPMPRFAMAINTLGVILFWAWTGILLVARWPYWFVAVGDIALCCAATWVFARSAIPTDGTRWHDGQ